MKKNNDNNVNGIIRSTINGSIPGGNTRSLKIINIDKFINRTFQISDQDNNMCDTTITDAIYNFEKSVLKNSLHAKFMTSLQSKNGKYDKMIIYNQLLDHLERYEQ